MAFSPKKDKKVKVFKPVVVSESTPPEPQPKPTRTVNMGNGKREQRS